MSEKPTDPWQEFLAAHPGEAWTRPEVEAAFRAGLSRCEPTAWYVFDPEDGFETFTTEAEARARADEIMEEESDRAAEDGWRDDIDMLEWGAMICHEHAVCVKREPAEDGSSFDTLEDWALCPPRSETKP